MQQDKKQIYKIVGDWSAPPFHYRAELRSWAFLPQILKLETQKLRPVLHHLEYSPARRGQLFMGKLFRD